MAQAAGSMDVLGNPENLKILANVLKTNVSAATSIGAFFTPQLGRIYMDMLGLYRAVSGIISETVGREGTLRSSNCKHRK
jgi:exportin-1